MPDLIDKCSDAIAWVNEIKAEYVASSVFGAIESSVIWSDAKGPDGKLLVPVDPVALAESINSTDYPLLNGHDPGFPLGKVLRAEVFLSPDGMTFVAAILGFYAGIYVGLVSLG